MSDNSSSSSSSGAEDSENDEESGDEEKIKPEKKEIAEPVGTNPKQILRSSSGESS
jgi:hypothetical protein